MKKEAERKCLLALKVALVLGMLASLFLVYEHFVPSASKYCSFGASLDCGIVNKSPYAVADGIFYLLVIDFKLPLPLIDISGQHWFLEVLLSNSFLGFLTMLLLFGIVRSYEKKKDFLWMSRSKLLTWAFGILLFGIAYGFYLFLIQHFILKTYCLVCLILDGTILTSLILVWRLRK